MSSSTAAPPGAVASDTQTVSSKQLREWLAPLVLGVLLLLIPAPSGLPHAAWRYFALFAAVTAALITEPLPGAAIGFFGVTIAAGLLLVGQTANAFSVSQLFVLVPERSWRGDDRWIALHCVARCRPDSPDIGRRFDTAVLIRCINTQGCRCDSTFCRLRRGGWAPRSGRFGIWRSRLIIIIYLLSLGLLLGVRIIGIGPRALNWNSRI